MSRCTGHCCKRFAIAHSPAELAADHERWKADPATSRIPDIEKIAPMVISLAASRGGEEYVYTCRNLGADGDCEIYETRPRMCRDFPEEKGCHFRGCQSSQSAYYGLPAWKAAWVRWKWLRSLSKET